MAFVGGLGGYAIFVGLRRLLPSTRASVIAASGIAAGISVVMASIAFVIEYQLGGTGDVSLRSVLIAMAGVHTLIGIGEGVITALTVGAVMTVRPDLVYGARDLRPVPAGLGASIVGEG